MSVSLVFPVLETVAANAWCTEHQYLEIYERSVKDPAAYWGEEGKRIDWIKPYSAVRDVSFGPDDVHIRWYYDGTLNAAANCLDRHLAARGDKVALYWEPDDPKADARSLTYRELHQAVGRFANGLKTIGVKKGDRVTIYLPMIPELVMAMLACARIGAIHSVVFGGFSPESLAGRINDCTSTVVITSDEGIRGGKPIPLKANVDAALVKTQTVGKVVVVKRTGGKIDRIAVGAV